MKQFLLTLLFITYLFSNAYVKKIVINGNLKTKESIILDQITHPVNSNFNLITAQKDYNNLKNLESFSQISIENYDSLYVIKLKEMSLVTWRPIIDKDENMGWFYGIGININNINGKTNSIHSELTTGSLDRYALTYTDTKIGNTNNKLKIKLFNEYYNDIESIYSVNNKTILFNFLLYNKNLNFSLKTYENKINSSIINIKKYKYISPTINFFNQEKFISTKYSEHLFELKYEYHYSYYTSSPNYYKIFFDIESFFDLSNTPNSLKLMYKVKCNLVSNNNAPIYENSYLGGDYNVRSYDINPSLNPISVKNKMKSLNTLITTTEIQIPIKINFPKWLMKIGYIPDSSNLIFFVDYGYNLKSYNDFNVKSKIKGYGIGVNINISDGKKLKLSVGLNAFGQQKIHISVN